MTIALIPAAVLLLGLALFFGCDPSKQPKGYLLGQILTLAASIVLLFTLVLPKLALGDVDGRKGEADHTNTPGVVGD